MQRRRRSESDAPPRRVARNQIVYRPPCRTRALSGLHDGVPVRLIHLRTKFADDRMERYVERTRLNQVSYHFMPVPPTLEHFSVKIQDLSHRRPIRRQFGDQVHVRQCRFQPRFGVLIKPSNRSSKSCERSYDPFRFRHCHALSASSVACARRMGPATNFPLNRNVPGESDSRSRSNISTTRCSDRASRIMKNGPPRPGPRPLRAVTSFAFIVSPTLLACRSVPQEIDWPRRDRPWDRNRNIPAANACSLPFSHSRLPGHCAWGLARHRTHSIRANATFLQRIVCPRNAAQSDQDGLPFLLATNPLAPLPRARRIV